MTAGNRIVGWFGTVDGRCNPTVQAWVVVTTEQLTASGSPFITSSHPFRLAPPKGCNTAAATRKPVGAGDGAASAFGINPIFGTLT